MTNDLKPFEVTWSVLVDAADPFDAARTANEIMTDPASVATILVVRAEGTEHPAYVIDVEDYHNPELVTVEKGDR